MTALRVWFLRLAEFARDGGPVRFLGYVLEIGSIRFYHSGDCLVYPELPATLAALAPDVLMIPINGRDHMREARGIVGNMNKMRLYGYNHSSGVYNDASPSGEG